MLVRLRAEVGVILEQLDRLANEVRPHIESVSDAVEPSRWYVAAFANMRASFYNGVENALVRIESLLDQPPDRGPNWHASLLERATQPTAVRSAVITEELANRLQAYMRLRHVVRHCYPFELDWWRMRPEVEELLPLIQEVRLQLTRFLDSLAKPE